MAQTRTTAFATAADAADSAPVLLVRPALSGSTRYWTSRAGTYGAQVYTELLKRGLEATIGMDAFGRTMRGVGRIELANESDGTGVRLSDILATDTVSARAVEVDLLMYGLTHPTDSIRLFTGMLEVPTDDCFDDQVLRLDLLDDGNPLWAGIQDLACARIHKIIGDKITLAGYPSADPDVLGMVKPLIYGSVTDTPALPVDAGAADLLQIDHTDVVATITCSDAVRFSAFPASGTVVCEGEEITYTGKGSLTLTTCTRGTGGTTAAAHPAGATVYEKKASYDYLVSARPCKSVGNVRVDGVLKTVTTDYTVSIGTPTTITFLSKPKSGTAVTVTAQPVFGATVTAEQSPGSVTVTAEQSPGSVTVGTEHGHATDTGTHTHVTGTLTTEYPTYPSLGAGTVTISATTAVTFANTPKSGASANWYCHVNVKSGTWTLAGQTLAAGEQWWTQASPTQDDQLSEVSSGDISIFEIRREITATGGADTHAATGVSASRTGATAASMASLSGSTAANMATLSGSTAVSLARTTNVAVSAADIVIGSEVLCDVEGEVDDGGGTFTGTPNALITNPSDQIRHILNIHLGLTLADWVDGTSFSDARTAFAASGIRCDWGIYDQIDSSELLERLRWSVGSRLFQGAAGKFKLYPLPLAGASQKTFTETSDILDESSGGGPIKVGRTELSDLYNQVYVLYGKIVTGNGYAGYDTSADGTSQGTYRMVRTLIIENDFVRDATAAAAIGDIYLAWHKDQKWRATMIADGIPCAHLEPCDKVSITSARMPGAWSTKAFFIESIGLRMVPPGQKSTATLVCREA